MANNPALMSMLQGRLGNLVGAPSGYVQTLSPEIRRRVNGLKSLQNKHAVLEAEFQNEILALEKKYLALYTPLYEKRAEFVSGKTEPTDAEVEDGVSEDEDEEDEDEDEEEDDKDAEKVEGKETRRMVKGCLLCYHRTAKWANLNNVRVTTPRSKVPLTFVLIAFAFLSILRHP